jgi:uncharacterized protein YyaL (SSP411 family)
MHQFTNKLISETSPYLLQHAHNPVDWLPWSDEALSLAKKENKPILVSIGYSACHWCHVMERESFEDIETAKLMNEKFINIKVDREERPDIDHIYMDAVQAMTGSGGWPLNVFLTPEGKPFYGGTYFPPKRAFNRPSWQEVLSSIDEAFNQRRNEIDAQAENLTEHLLQSNSFGISTNTEVNFFAREKLDDAFLAIMKNADKVWGGFGRAPKFPQTFVIQFLLRYHYVTGNKEAFDQALLSIDKMIDGGIYDQVGGGFARYSTDTEWLAPHFEKMLYDNALILSVIAEIYQITNNKKYKEVIDETIGFLQREMRHSDGGFYAALDADSEGEEGKFYVWNYEEVNKLLGNDAEIFCKFFDITPVGNWEHKNIPRRIYSEERFCEEQKISAEELYRIINQGKKKLLDARSKRVRPGSDDKILLAWNALLITALCKCFAATGNENYKQLAIENMQFMLAKFSKNGSNHFFHSYKNGIAKQPAFLDDYAFLIQALILVQEVTGETNYLDKAKDLSEHVLRNFIDHSSEFFFYTEETQTDVIVRKKEVYDGAQPSGNSIMADNLHRLGIYFDKPEWKIKAQAMINSLGNAIIRYPTSFGIWASLLQEIVDGTNEIVVITNSSQGIITQMLKEYLPHSVMMISNNGGNHYPLLSGKEKTGETTIFLCRDYACEKPVSTVQELLAIIRRK